MIDKLIEIKQKSNVLYYLVLALIAIPVLGLIFVSIISPAIRAYLVNSAQKLMKSSREKDEVLKKDIDQTQKQIDKTENELAAIDAKIEEAQKSNDLNWHKNMGKK